jgi:hypothetical protein
VSNYDDEDRIWIEPPSSERYERLAGKLINIERDRASKKIVDLHAARDSLVAVIEFILSDAQLAKHHAASSLGAMAAAVHDLLNGAKPLFFEQKNRSRKGPPTNQSKAVVRGQINVALDSLLEAGISMLEASSWLARELATEGVKLGGQRIEGKQIKGWHYEKRGKSLSGSDRAYEILNKPRAQLNTPDIAKKFALAKIQSLKAMGF